MGVLVTHYRYCYQLDGNSCERDLNKRLSCHGKTKVELFLDSGAFEERGDQDGLSYSSNIWLNREGRLYRHSGHSACPGKIIQGWLYSRKGSGG